MRAPLMLLLACLVMSATARGQDNEDGTRFTLIAELQDGSYVWVRDGETNPTLVVPPNEQVTIHIQQGETSPGVPHTLQVGGGETSGRIADPGESANVTFSSPPSGTLPYVCTIHPSTMRGEIEIRDADAQESTGDGVPLPATALVLGVLAIAALAWRRRAT